MRSGMDAAEEIHHADRLNVCEALYQQAAKNDTGDSLSGSEFPWMRTASECGELSQRWRRCERSSHKARLCSARDWFL